MTLMASKLASKLASGGPFFSPCACCRPGFAATDIDTARRTFLAGGLASLGLAATTALAQAPIATKFPEIRWIFSHAGGTLPFLTARLEVIAQQKKMAGGAAPILRKFYYELAQGNTPGQLAALLKMVPISQGLYGTDYPFRNGAEVNAGIANYGFTADDIRSIEREIAFKLIPRLKQT